MTALLSVNNLTIYTQSQKVVDQVSFEVQTGETLAIVGESGSGKTLTALAILQLLPSACRFYIDKTDICFQGESLLKYNEIQMRNVRGKKIAMVFQEPMSVLNPVLPIYTQIKEVLDCHQSLSQKAIKSHILHLLEEVGIEDVESRLNHYPHQFSGGMRQRVLIAMALAGSPDLLIADEPTTALDANIRLKMMTLLQKIQQKRGMGVLLISHDLNMVQHFATRIVVMSQGKIVEENDTQNLFSKPKHAYTQALLAALPKPKQPETDTQALPILSVDELSVFFPIKMGMFRRHVSDVRAVDTVSFQVIEGCTFALVGESGSGKSTIAKTIVQLLEPTSGQILFQGHRTHLCQEYKKSVQIVFQDPFSSLNPRMRIVDTLLEGMRLHDIGQSDEERIEKLKALFQYVGLDTVGLWRYPHAFSGGQRQRICIVRALAVEPKLLVLDEPTSALDVSVQAQLLNLLKTLQKQFGLTYLLITHDMAVVANMADEVSVMKSGKIIESGAVDCIFTNPKETYTQQLLKAHAIPNKSC